MVVSVEQACELLGCKRRQIFYLLARGILEAAPRYGRTIRIYRATVERALQPLAPKQGRKRRRIESVHVDWEVEDLKELLT